jgi:short-subunit dehydrogenase
MVALVTGASSGMGKEVAKQLQTEGYTVYAAARRIEAMDDLKALGIRPLRLDVTQADEIESAVRQIEAQAGGVDVLVNNAGFGLYGAVEDVPLDKARYQFEVNLFSMAGLTQRVLPGMRKKGKGWIVNISSMGGKIYTPLGAWYHATKHAVEGWSDCLRFETAPFGIKVIIVEPGAIATEFGQVMSGPMLEFSGRGAYATLAAASAKLSESTYGRPNAASPTTVISRTISKALRARHPKTRYVAGLFGREFIALRRLLGDRGFDGMLRMMYR